jgi:hypothetical protein
MLINLEDAALSHLDNLKLVCKPKGDLDVLRKKYDKLKLALSKASNDLEKNKAKIEVN